MTNILVPIGVVQLTDGFTTVYQVTAGKTFTVSMIHLSNNTGSDRTVRVVLDTGGGDTQAQALCWDLPVKANDFLEFGKGDLWPSGAKLRALCDAASSVTLKPSGIES